MRRRNKTPAAGGLAGAGTQRTERDANRKAGRPEIQGNRNGRSGRQRAPQWAVPPQTEALDMLARLWGKP